MSVDTIKVTQSVTPQEWPEFERLISPLIYGEHLKRAYQVLVVGLSLEAAGRKTDNVTGGAVRYSLERVYKFARRFTDESEVLRIFVAKWEGRDPAGLAVPIVEDGRTITVLMLDETDGELKTLDLICPVTVRPEAFKQTVIRWRDNTWTFQEIVTFETDARYLVFRRRPVIDVDAQQVAQAAEAIQKLATRADYPPKDRLDTDAKPLLDCNDIARRLSISFSLVWKLQKQADFPKPHDGNGKAKVWKEADIDHWIKSRSVGCGQ